MKTNDIVEHIIRNVLKNTKPVYEQKIKTPEQLKYTFDKNIKTPADADEFANWVRENYAFDFRDLSLSRQGNSISDPNLRKAFESYGKEWIQSKDFVSGENKPFYTKSWFIWSAMIPIVLSILYAKSKIIQSLFRKFGSTMMRLSARRAEMARAKMSPKEIDEVIEFIQTLGTFRSKTRRQYVKDQIAAFLEKQSARTKQQAQEESETVLKAIEDNPAIQSSIKVEITGALAENFMKGNGVTASDLKQVMTPENWKKYGKEFQEIEKTRMSKTKKPVKAADTVKAKISLSPIGKLLGNKGQVWTQLEGKTVSSNDITKSIQNAVKGSDISLKQAITLKSELEKLLSSKLKRSAGTKTGTWLLTKHIKASSFPSFEIWKSDLKSAGVSRTVSETDYYMSKSIWNLTK